MGCSSMPAHRVAAVARALAPRRRLFATTAPRLADAAASADQAKTPQQQIPLNPGAKNAALRDLARFQREMKALRKQYYAETKAKLDAQRAEVTDAQRAEIEQKTMSDPMVVGTYKPRRQLKRERHRNFGAFSPIPTNLAQPLPPRTQRQLPPPPTQEEVEEHLRKICARDLQPDNPRLMHLLHLWHASESFITPNNIDAKIDEFFKCTRDRQLVPDVTTAELMGHLTPGGVPGSVLVERLRTMARGAAKGDERDIAYKLHAIAEHGLPNHPSYRVEFDASQFAEADKHYAPLRDAAEPARKLLGAHATIHAVVRQQVLQDRVTSSLMGKPGVAKVLEWGKTSNEETASTTQEAPPVSS